MNSILNEYGVLGSLLIDPSLFPEAAELPDDMFSSVPLQEIFRAMRHQYEESGSFDALTVRVEAGRNCTDVSVASSYCLGLGTAEDCSPP